MTSWYWNWKRCTLYPASLLWITQSGAWIVAYHRGVHAPFLCNYISIATQFYPLYLADAVLILLFSSLFEQMITPEFLRFCTFYQFQIEDEDPLLLWRLFDFVRWWSLYPIWYNPESQEFYGLFIPSWWDKLRGLQTDRIMFDEEWLNDNIMVFDKSFTPCRLSKLGL